MINNKKVLAVIPARGGSKGIPSKNIKVLHGKPLIAWSIDEGKKSKYIDKLIVSTDSEKIAEVAKKYGAEVPFMRPAELASDTATSISVMFHALDFLEEQNEKYDYVIMLEPTSPLRTVEDIDIALERLADNKSAKAIVGVAKLEAGHPEFNVTIKEGGFIKPFLGGDVVIVKRRQDLDDIYFFEGTVYISDVDTLRQKKTFYHELTLAHIVEKYKSFEIDEEMDLIIIEALMKYKESKGGKI